MRRIAEMAKSQNETGTDEPKRNIRFFVGGMHFSSAFLHRRRRKIEKIFVKKRREFYGLGEKHCIRKERLPDGHKKNWQNRCRWRNKLFPNGKQE